jgi:hypothetical protein
MTNVGTRHLSLREEMLQDLLGGAAGLARWNARPEQQRRSAGLFRGADLRGALLSGANLASLDLSGALLDRANLAGAWLLECNLEQASFQGANLERAWCAGACLREANFQSSALARANLRGCDCRKARFPGANLIAANLDGADLRGADLAGGNLTGASVASARYDAQTSFPPTFAPAQALEWAGEGSPPVAFDVFVKHLRQDVDTGRLGRALDMLKGERFWLYSQVDEGSLCGVVKSQTEEGLVYSCRLASDGSFACCSQDLELCLGLRTALCKHILVLVVGLARGRKIDPCAVERWVKASKSRRPKLDREAMSETFLRYKSAEAGEIDWRPTETIPEDYYAL